MPKEALKFVGGLAALGFGSFLVLEGYFTVHFTPNESQMATGIVVLYLAWRLLRGR